MPLVPLPHQERHGPLQSIMAPQQVRSVEPPPTRSDGPMLILRPQANSAWVPAQCNLSFTVREYLQRTVVDGHRRVGLPRAVRTVQLSHSWG